MASAIHESGIVHVDEVIAEETKQLEEGKLYARVIKTTYHMSDELAKKRVQAAFADAVEMIAEVATIASGEDIRNPLVRSFVKLVTDIHGKLDKFVDKTVARANPRDVAALGCAISRIVDGAEDDLEEVMDYFDNEVVNHLEDSTSWLNKGEERVSYSITCDEEDIMPGSVGYKVVIGKS